MGLLYALGEGVPQDTEKAKYWLKKAIDQGDEAPGEIYKKLF